jgi:hypothetical protein
MKPYFLIAAGFAGFATPAMADIRSFTCQMTEACRQMGTNCSAIDRTHVYNLDAEAGTGEMIQEGQPFDGEVLTSNEALHFVFTNSAGIEMATIANGSVVFLGNMVIGGEISHYRLTGTCTESGAAAAAGSK